MASVLELSGVTVIRDGNTILNSVDWEVDGEQRWAILGPNGAGKTTLLQVASASIHPSSGSASVLGEQIGKVDLFELRPRIGFASSKLGKNMPGDETVLNAVMTAAYSVTGRWNEQYEELDERRARRVLAEWNLSALADRRYFSLSDGEQKRVQIARAVMTDPELMLLDEPAASLDLGAREELLQLLSGYAGAPEAPAIIMVTHHVEEIPPGFTHALLLSHGTITASGPIHDVITAENLSATFGLGLDLAFDNGRFTARAS